MSFRRFQVTFAYKNWHVYQQCFKSGAPLGLHERLSDEGGRGVRRMLQETASPPALVSGCVWRTLRAKDVGRF